MENRNYNKKQSDKVFISFRGKDQRHKFLSHLKQKLIDHKVNVFTDEDGVGEQLKNLFGHIRNSRIAIVIFSECYPESEWCWDELVWIHKCIEMEKMQVVIPIFHDVDISKVVEQIEEFGQKFWALQISLLSKKGIGLNDIKDINFRIESWKRALIAVTAWEGMPYYINTSEADFVEKVVVNVKKYLPKTVAAGEGRNSVITETSESLERKQSNLTVFNNSRVEVNNYHFHHSSLEALEALSLGKWKPEGYNMSFDFMKSMPRDYRRNNSDLDNLYAPFPVEGLIAQKRIENQQSIDNALQQNYRAWEMHNSTPATNELDLNNYPLDFYKSSKALNPEGNNMPLSGDFRSTNSDLDHRNQYGPYPSKATMVEKHPENQRIVDNIPKKKYRSGKSCLSSMRYCFGRCLCLNESEQKMIQSSSGNEPSVARN